VTGDGGRLRILDRMDGDVLADVPAASLHEDAPLYDRPLADPAEPTPLPPGAAATPADCGADVLASAMDTSWVWQQYDHQLFLNTVAGPGAEAAVLKLKHPLTGEETGRALALTTDGNHRWCAVDPRVGTAMVVAESALNLACVGARPLALVNCLNFGNPEHPEVMRQLSDAIDGMADACRALGIPVVGGNVSLYNESKGTDIDPTPVVGLLGMVDRLERRPPGHTLVEGARLVLVGPRSSDLGGSRWAASHHGGGRPVGTLPPLDLAHHEAVCDVIRNLVLDGAVLGIHDVADGGIAAALAELVAGSSIGVTVSGLDGHAELFGEAASRVLVCVAADQVPDVERRCLAAGVTMADLGRAGGDRLVVDDLVDLTVTDVTSAWRGPLPEAFAHGAVSG